MGRKNNRLLKRGQELELDIKEMAFGGVGIGGIQTEQGEFKVFVQNTIPQQKVKAKVVKSKRRHAECKLMEVLERSPLETSIPYQPIPGAPYATLPIEEQHRLKQESTVDLLQRIGNIQKAPELLEGLISSPENWHYRNKMEYSFSCIEYSLKEKKELDDQFALGFKHRGTWWAVENLDKDSGLFDAEFENQLPHLRDWMKSSGLPAWHPPRREGYFRFLVVRKSFDQNKLLINLVTTSHDEGKFDDNAFVAKTLELLGEQRVAGIFHTINDDKGERVQSSAGAPKLIYGDPVVTEDIHGLKFDISMESFFQTNPASASRLYSKAIEYAGDLRSESETIMDLFCGTGTITQLLAQGTDANVVGVDIVEKAITDAKLNASKNGVDQVNFFAADVGKFLFEHPEYVGKINTLVMDPPRGGIAPKTLRKVLNLGAKRMVYVSCNPATLARDAQTLEEAGYQLKKWCMVDQFPHT
ncbi:MAG: 23S rRNA (uracil(1939)-C(5))-methyltransferase RlmD, partial [Flavobacteriales bacterium]|nr:23S rRNA (uracil(1939)-C(5))-methyltransferase RlmD [Flavobacteriales bacterium]